MFTKKQAVPIYLDGPQLSTPPPQPVQRKRRHVFRWVFLGVQALFLFWVIAGTAGGASSAAKSCAGLAGSALRTCQESSNVGTGIGVVMVIVLWALVDVILGITWMVVRPRH